MSVDGSKEECECRVGIYLNEPGAYGMFRRDYALECFVDKSDIIEELSPLWKNSCGEHDCFLFWEEYRQRQTFS